MISVFALRIVLNTNYHEQFMSIRVQKKREAQIHAIKRYSILS